MLQMLKTLSTRAQFWRQDVDVVVEGDRFMALSKFILLSSIVKHQISLNTDAAEVLAPPAPKLLLEMRLANEGARCSEKTPAPLKESTLGKASVQWILYDSTGTFLPAE